MGLNIGFAPILIGACGFFPAFSTAFAGGEPADASGESGWETDIRASALVNAWGFTPAEIVASTGEYTVDGNRLDATQARFQLSGALRGRWLHWDFQPFTDVPPSEGSGYHINTVGLATALYVPIGDAWRVGFYHYSAHNAADDQFGFGPDLNAIATDLLVFNGQLRFPGFDGRHGLRLHAHYYLIDRGSPWVLTRETHLEAGSVGRIRARSGFLYILADDGLRGECGGYSTVSSDGRIGAAFVDCAALWRASLPFLGVAGRHLQVGPYLGYGRNLTRTRDLGRQNLHGGIRFDLLVQENTSQGPIFW